MTEAARIHAKRRRLVTGMLSLGGHAAVIATMVVAQPDIRPPPELPAIQVQLVELPPPPPPSPPAPKVEPDPAPPNPPLPKVEKKPKPTPPKRTVSRPVKTTTTPEVKPIQADAGKVTDLSADVSDAELASAATAGTGSGGGGGGGQCDMAGWLQAKLRKDRRVQSALARTETGRAIRVWNGDWVTHPGQEGKGLAAVREAIMWEVAFAPEACRKQRVRGLVALALNDGGKVVLGAGDWRWSDVLFAPGRRG